MSLEGEQTDGSVGLLADATPDYKNSTTMIIQGDKNGSHFKKRCSKYW